MASPVTNVNDVLIDVDRATNFKRMKEFFIPDFQDRVKGSFLCRFGAMAFFTFYLSEININPCEK